MSEYAIRLLATGGPENLSYEPVELPPPGPGQLRIRQTAVGLDFVDVLQRIGRYPTPGATRLGSAAAGVVEAVGPVSGRTPDGRKRTASGYAVGDRVAYATVPFGAYATARNVAADKVVPLPAGISAEDAAAVLLKGLTVWALIRQVHPVRAGETVLFHAAAGGVGLIAGQWLTHLGAHAIGTAGAVDKAKLAAENGYEEVVLYRTEDVAGRVRELTDGIGVPVVYDSVGAATFTSSLDSLRPRGLLALFGSASGPVTDFDLAVLAAKGALYVTRPTLSTYLPDVGTLRAASAELFELVTTGAIKPNIRQRFDLADAGKAQEALESRATVGATVLLP